MSFALIDTFPAFLDAWPRLARLPVQKRLTAWADDYLAAWPTLLAMQVADYARQGLDWRQVAAAHVAPYWAERLETMRCAHRRLLRVAEPLARRAAMLLPLERLPVFVIYVGIGCGAGWATTYEGRDAILLELEAIAAEGWGSEPILEGLLAHEIGHVWHAEVRRRAGLPAGAGPWRQLYCEGVAMYCEQLVTTAESGHMAVNAPGWAAWCRQRRGWLAAEFVRQADSSGDVRPFFGSWFAIEGFSQTGYFLGAQAIAQLVARLGLAQVAVLNDYQALLRDELGAMALGSVEKSDEGGC